MHSVILLFCSFVPTTQCDDADRPAAEKRVQVTVIAILGTDQNAKIDEQLGCIAKEIQKKDPTLTGFQLAQTSKESLVVGKATKFNLYDRETADIVVRHGADKDNRVSLKVKPPRMGEITYTSACGKFFPILTRYYTNNHERLIIAIMVKPCQKDSK